MKFFFTIKEIEEEDTFGLEGPVIYTVEEVQEEFDNLFSDENLKVLESKNYKFIIGGDGCVYASETKEGPYEMLVFRD